VRQDAVPTTGRVALAALPRPEPPQNRACHSSRHTAQASREGVTGKAVPVSCALIADLDLWGYHPRNSKGSEPGWPDWCILGAGGILFRELKSEHGSLTPEQRAVGARITRAGGNWAIWRPRDLLHGTIARQLTNLAAIQGELFGAGP